MPCETKNRPLLWGADGSKKLATILRPDCRTWACPHCSTKMRQYWSKRVFHGMRVYSAMPDGRPWNFVTLTSHEKLRDFDHTARVFKSAWRKLYWRLKYKHGKIHYVLIPEKHQDGRLHFHMLVDVACGTRWYKDKGRACGLGYMADEEQLHNAAKGSFYVTKYLAKSLTVAEWTPKFRRIRTSTRFPDLPTAQEGGGSVVWKAAPKRSTTQSLSRYLTGLGFKVDILDSALS